MPQNSTPVADHSSGASDTSEDLTLTELDGDEINPPRRLGSLRLLLLTCPNFGLQISWLLLMSYGTPYLHSLKIPDSITALVWLVGPLCGAFVQPIFGYMSDQSNHAWGKRKSFIICGASSVVICLLALACTEDLTGDHIGFGFRPEPKHSHKGHRVESSHLLTQLLAVFWVCAINICIQPFQSGVRALIVDNCPPDQQVQASAWSTRWNGLGSVFISFFGFADTAKWAPFLGQSQFKILAVIAALSIAITVSLVCSLVEDQPAFTEGNSLRSIRSALVAPIRRISSSLKNLSPNIRQVCKVQAAAWLGWFPILYYTSTFVYQTFIIENHVHTGTSSDGRAEQIGGSDYRLIEAARQEASFAVFTFALVALLTSITLPFLVRPTTTQTIKDEIEVQIQTLPTILGFPLPRIWQLSHLLLLICMLTTFISWTVPVATAIIATAGISWAIATWIPFAIISSEISRASATVSRTSSSSSSKWEEPDRDETATILGLQNMAISLPQIVAALGCALLFKGFECLGVRDGAAWVFRLAGVAAGAAAWLTRGLEV